MAYKALYKATYLAQARGQSHTRAPLVLIAAEDGRVHSPDSLGESVLCVEGCLVTHVRVLDLRTHTRNTSQLLATPPLCAIARLDGAFTRVALAARVF